MTAPRVNRWQDQGGRTNRVTLIRAFRRKKGDYLGPLRDVTVVFSPEEWAVIEAEVFAQHGLISPGEHRRQLGLAHAETERREADIRRLEAELHYAATGEEEVAS